MSELITVGTVFGIFTSQPCNIIGIEVTDNPFGIRNQLVCVDPDNPAHRIAVHVATLEIDKWRYNVATPGVKCGVKPHQINEYPKPGWPVLVADHLSKGAAQRIVRRWPRPQPKRVQSGGYVKPYTW